MSLHSFIRVYVSKIHSDLMYQVAGARHNEVHLHSVKAAAAARGHPKVKGHGWGEESAVATRDSSSR